MTARYTLGIDPGVSGAIACLDENQKLCWVLDMPVMTLSGTKQQVNGAEITRFFKENLTRGSSGNFLDVLAYVELVHTMPGQGGSSQGNFMMSYGKVLGALEALGIPYRLVTPQSWKRRAGVPGKKTGPDGKKNINADMSRTLAQQLYPDAPLGLKKHVGRADAILIAKYGGAV
ncbi:MAG: hypothetical protein WC378_21000 [Opitutaceae bacterium]|jgi:crossover junction endodeoxyribonuclease RuvC